MCRASGSLGREAEGLTRTQRAGTGSGGMKRRHSPVALAVALSWRIWRLFWTNMRDELGRGTCQSRVSDVLVLDNL